MNTIYLRGIIKNIKYSHTIDDITFNRAELIVKRPDGREDILIIKFKQFSMNFKENTQVELVGNIRSYSQLVDGKYRVEIYVFTYFDEVEIESDNINNFVKLDGKICKKDTIRTTSKGKHYIHFIIANNLIMESQQKLNSYIPCVAWGKDAKHIMANYNVGDSVYIEGQLQSREYKKKVDEEIEIRVAHEVLINTISEVNE